MSPACWPWITWTLLAFAGTLGLLAAACPRQFCRLAAWCNLWVDTDRLGEKLDRWVDVDRYVLRNCRLFGAVVLLAATVLAGLLAQFAFPGWWAVCAVLGGVGILGLVALAWPQRFQRLATWGRTWVDTDGLAKRLDVQIDIDRYVLRHTRLFGALITTVVLALAGWLVWA